MDDPGGLKRKRAQVARACQRCASAKRRCSGTFPCDRCIHLGAQDSCVEVRVKKKGASAPQRGGFDEFDESYEDDADRRALKRRSRPVASRRGGAHDDGGSNSEDGHTGVTPRLDRLQAWDPTALAVRGSSGAAASAPPPHFYARPQQQQQAQAPGRARAQSGEDVFAGVDLLLRASGESSEEASAAAVAARAAATATRAHATRLLHDDGDGGGAEDDAGASPRLGTPHIPAAPPDIGITAESDLVSLMPYPAWRIVFAPPGGSAAVDERRVWGGVFPLQGVSANAAGCDLFNIAAEDLPYLSGRCRSVAWLHPDDIRGRSEAAAEVRRLRRRYYEWAGRYIRVVPSAAASRPGAAPAAATYQLFFAVERIFIAYHPGPAGAARQVLSVFSMVQDSGEVLPPEVYARALQVANAPPPAHVGDAGGGEDAAMPPLPWPRIAPGGRAAALSRSSMDSGSSPLGAHAAAGAAAAAAAAAGGFRGGGAAQALPLDASMVPAGSSSSIGLGLGSAWTSSGSHHGGGRSFTEQGAPAALPLLPPPPQLGGGGGGAAGLQRGSRLSRDGPDFADGLLNGGGPSQWPPDASALGGGGAGAGVGVPGGGGGGGGAPHPGRYSFSEVLRGLSGDWTGEPVAGQAQGVSSAGAAAAASAAPAMRGASFGLMADDALSGPPAAAALRPDSLSGGGGSFSGRRASSGGSGLSGLLSPTGGGGLRGGSFGAAAGDPFGGAPLPPLDAGSGSGGGGGRLPVGNSWATDLATRAALAAVGGVAPDLLPLNAGGGAGLASRGVSDGSGVSLLGGGAAGGSDAGGRLWGEDTADGASYAGEGGGGGGRDRGGSRASADFTFGFPSLGLGGGGPGGGGGGSGDSPAQ